MIKNINFFRVKLFKKFLNILLGKTKNYLRYLIILCWSLKAATTHHDEYDDDDEKKDDERSDKGKIFQNNLMF